MGRLERESLLEAIDALGYIAFYSKDSSAETVLLKMYHAYDSDPLIIWKLLRAFQAFPSVKVQGILEAVVLENPDPALRREAIRSLGQLGRMISSALINKAEQDPHAEVKKTARFFLGI